MDYCTSVTVEEYAPVANSVEFKSADGNAFDRDEYGSRDIKVVVKDQYGQPLDGQNFFYSWDYTPFEPSTSDTARTIPETFVQTGASGEAKGEATLVFPNPSDGAKGGKFVLNGYVNRDNSPGQGSDDLAISPETIKAGESDVVWQDGVTAQRQSGTAQVFKGAVELADGTVLPSRSLTVDWKPGDDGNAVSTDDAVIAPQADQPSGTTRTSTTSANVTTGADGGFGVAVTDPDPAPAGGEPNELNGTLTATGTGQIGNDAVQPLDVDFLKSAAPAHVDVVDDSIDYLMGDATPGRPVSFTVKVTDGSTPGVPLANQVVTLKTDRGFFTDAARTEGDLKADPKEAQGGLYGEWHSLGDTTQVKTDENGEALVTVAIGRDGGFDNDGKVTSNITMAAGPAEQTPKPFQIEWTTIGNPLNPKSVKLSLADHQDSTVLPYARIDQLVYFDVFACDQFGNLVKDDVAVKDNTDDAYINADWDNGTVELNFTDDSPALEAYGARVTDEVTDQEISAKWTQSANVYGSDANTTTPGYDPTVVHPDKTVEDTARPINWYTVNFDEASYTWSSDPAGDSRVPVGTPVHQSVEVKDHLGQPIPDMRVKFVRTGPNEQGGDYNETDYTAAAGIANYDWVGTSEGTANVSAFVYDGWVKSNTGALVKKFTSDPITFGEEPHPHPKPHRHHIEADLKLSNDRHGNDVASVYAPDAAKGATVKLFRIGAHGKKYFVRKATANKHGNAYFVVHDKKEKSRTTFVAYVSRTAKTWSDWTSRKSIR